MRLECFQGRSKEEMEEGILIFVLEYEKRGLSSRRAANKIYIYKFVF